MSFQLHQKRIKNFRSRTLLTRLKIPKSRLTTRKYWRTSPSRSPYLLDTQYGCYWHLPRTTDPLTTITWHPDVQNQAKSQVIIDGKPYIQASTHWLKYDIAAHQKAMNKVSSLVDCGANGGLAGEDVLLIEQTARYADVSGINDHTIEGLPIATAAGIVEYASICIPR